MPPTSISGRGRPRPRDWGTIPTDGERSGHARREHRKGTVADDSGGEKTEKPTPKKLRDARRKGDVPKSRDLVLAVGLLAALPVLWQLVRLAPERLSAVLDAAIATASGGDFAESLDAVGAEAISTALSLSVLALVPIAVVGLLVTFLQIGPVLAFEKIAPKLSNLDPVAGFKRLFGVDGLVECAKAVLLCLALFAIGGYLILSGLADLMRTPYAPPTGFAEAMLGLTLRMTVWSLAVFAFVTVLDIAWQHHSFEKKMKMSFRDIKDEHKNSEGDPQMKGERRKLAKQWAGEGSKKAASKASVLVVNPIHIAVAVLHDERTTPVPKVIGRGEEELAREMRDAAAEAGVPVLRNELLARTLLRDTKDGDLVPRELFGIIAEVTLWSIRARERIERERRGERKVEGGRELPVPGEDMTRYPDDVDARMEVTAPTD